MTETDDQHIDPTSKQITRLAEAAEQNPRPVVMINLLAFNDHPGRGGYERYSEEVQPHLLRVGAEVVYKGDSAEMVIGAQDKAWWDAIVVVRYPSRAKFLEMVRDPGYQQITVLHRATALETSALIATEPRS